MGVHLLSSKHRTVSRGVLFDIEYHIGVLPRLGRKAPIRQSRLGVLAQSSHHALFKKVIEPKIAQSLSLGISSKGTMYTRCQESLRSRLGLRTNT